MNRYIVRATRIQNLEVMVCGHDEDDAFDNAMASTDWEVIDTDLANIKEFIDVTNDHNYQEES